MFFKTLEWQVGKRALLSPRQAGADGEMVVHLAGHLKSTNPEGISWQPGWGWKSRMISGAVDRGQHIGGKCFEFALDLIIFLEAINPQLLKQIVLFSMSKYMVIINYY